MCIRKSCVITENHTQFTEITFNLGMITVNIGFLFLQIFIVRFVSGATKYPIVTVYRGHRTLVVNGYYYQKVRRNCTTKGHAWKCIAKGCKAKIYFSEREQRVVETIYEHKHSQRTRIMIST